MQDLRKVHVVYPISTDVIKCLRVARDQNEVYLLGIKKMQAHSLTNFCIVMYVDMACIIMYCYRTDDISITRSKRVNKKIILVQDNDQFPCKSSGSWFIRIISYDRYGLHYHT